MNDLSGARRWYTSEAQTISLFVGNFFLTFEIWGNMLKVTIIKYVFVNCDEALCSGRISKNKIKD